MCVRVRLEPRPLVHARVDGAVVHVTTVVARNAPVVVAVRVKGANLIDVVVTDGCLGLCPSCCAHVKTIPRNGRLNG